MQPGKQSKSWNLRWSEPKRTLALVCASFSSCRGESSEMNWISFYRGESSEWTESECRCVGSSLQPFRFSQTPRWRVYGLDETVFPWLMGPDNIHLLPWGHAILPLPCWVQSWESMKMFFVTECNLLKSVWVCSFITSLQPQLSIERFSCSFWGKKTILSRMGNE